MSRCCFIYSSTDGHLGSFHILVIVNNVAMNIRVLMFFQISVLGFFGYIPRSGISGSKADPFLIFLRYLHSAFHSGCTNLSACPPTVQKGSPFSTSSPALVVCLYIYDSHSDRCEVVPYHTFIVI